MKSRILGFLIAVTFLSIVSSTPATASTVSLRPVADTYIYRDLPEQNYGSSTELMVGRLTELGWLETRIRFSGIPSGALIQSATLLLYIQAGTGIQTVSVQCASSSWEENTLTWGTPNSQARWGTPNSPFMARSQTGFVALDVTAHVQAWADGSRPNYGFHLSSADAPIGITNTFASRETVMAPKLTITYTVQEADLMLRNLSVSPSRVTWARREGLSPCPDSRSSSR